MYKYILLFQLIFTINLFADAYFDLLRYSYIGDTKKVTEILKMHPNLNDKEEDPYIYAAYKNHLDTLKILVEHGAEINAHMAGWKNALMYAFENKNVEMVNYLLQIGVKPIVYDNDKDILYEAVHSGNAQLVKIALPYVKERNNYYKLDKEMRTTLLIEAVHLGNLANVKLLLENGVDINKPNEKAQTPIMIALKEKRFKIAELLLSEGAKLDGEDKKKNSVLSYAIRSHQTKIALKAIDHSDLKGWMQDGYNYLHLAAINNNPEIIKALLKKGMDPNKRDTIKRSKLPPFIWAIKKDNYEAFKTFLDAGADPYEVFKGPGQSDSTFIYLIGGGSYYTPLSYAVTGDNFNAKIVQTLLNLEHFNKYVEKESQSFYLALLTYKYTPTPNQKYAIEILKRFDEGGFQANGEVIVLGNKIKEKESKELQKKPSRHTLIDNALEAGDEASLRQLKKEGIDLPKEYTGAPHMAIVYGHSEMVLGLLDLGYDANETMFNDENLLHSLSTPYTTSPEFDRKKELLYLELIRRGADINHIDFYGLTPLYYLIKNKKAKESFINELISKGASLGDETKVLEFLFTLKSKEELLQIIHDPRLQESLNKLYAKANFTQLVLKSMKSRKTPLSITEILFEIAYTKKLFIAYDLVAAYAEQQEYKHFLKIIKIYYGA